MAMIKSVGEFFSLDIGITSVRVVQLTLTAPGRWTLKHYGYAPLDIKTATSDSTESKHRLGEVIMTVVGQSGIKTKNVVIGLPSNKTFVTVVDMPMLSDDELKGTIKYQIDQYIPMSTDDAKVDWVSLGQSLHDPSQQEVLLASTSASYSEERLEFVEGLGFDVIAAEPDSLAMIRSLLPANAPNAQVIIDIGETSTNVAMTYGDVPRLVRTIPNGLSTMVRAVVQNLSVEEAQARQFILKFGLTEDKLEGQVSRALESTLDSFVLELAKSIKFFQTRYPSVTVGSIILSGFAGTISGLGDYISVKTSLQTSVGDPWQRVTIPSGDETLRSVSGEFAAAVGLAQRGSGA